MNRVELMDRLGDVSMDLDKARFAASEIMDVFSFNFETDDLTLQAYEVERNRPLADILMDYIVSVDDRVKELTSLI